MEKKLLLCTGLLIHTIMLCAQAAEVPLDQVIELARSRSPRYKLAMTQKEIKRYQFLSYQSDFRPQVSFYGNAPVFNKEYYGVRQPDGTIQFQSISQNNADLGFGISQQIYATGGELSLNTSMTRFDDFKAKTHRYNGTPVYLRLSQPLFAFNELKWRRKTEPLKFEESQREYFQEMETIAQQTVKLYFDLLESQNNIQIASVNLTNAKVNYEIESKRINLGTTTEDKLLQLELQVLSNEQAMEKAKYDFQIAQLGLKVFTGIKDSLEITPLLPQNVAEFSIELNKAIEYATIYRPEFIAFERKKQEAQRDLEQAKAAGRQVKLVASYGFNNIGNDLADVYANPNDQQRFNIGFTIPVLDWGRRKSRYNTAREIQKLNTFNNDYDASTILQEITTLVKNFELLKRNILLAKKSDSVAQRRYALANDLYKIGKLALTDLNLAQTEKDDARRNYIRAFRSYWDSYYMLRRLTLYDFEKNIPLINK